MERGATLLVTFTNEVLLDYILKFSFREGMSTVYDIYI